MTSFIFHFLADPGRKHPEENFFIVGEDIDDPLCLTHNQLTNNQKEKRENYPKDWSRLIVWSRLSMSVETWKLNVSLFFFVSEFLLGFCTWLWRNNTFSLLISVWNCNRWKRIILCSLNSYCIEKFINNILSIVIFNTMQ